MAAALPLSGLTALRELVDHAAAQAGKALTRGESDDGMNTHVVFLGE
ncbi:hypothetical protein MB901379_01551 [Mycobacterium basiliense]|uniref:Uncharacterized protein n=1 Tax=Mycobacterium basiliense TaxID=2094119 RepID=A0A447GBY5_9MYCO|nr:hypothetical protein [Mycobacterium basiliense]VDM87997.1 hypothetical protein MB901379_01551 [Mycobacterium basiliense]